MNYTERYLKGERFDWAHKLPAKGTHTREVLEFIDSNPDLAAKVIDFHTCPGSKTSTSRSLSVLIRDGHIGCFKIRSTDPIRYFIYASSSAMVKSALSTH